MSANCSSMELEILIVNNSDNLHYTALCELISVGLIQSFHVQVTSLD